MSNVLAIQEIRLNERVYHGKLIKASLDDSSIRIALHLHCTGLEKGESDQKNCLDRGT